MTKNFFFAVAITFSGFINAQNSESDSEFKFGVKAGYTLSNMKFFDNKLDSKSYFYAGLVGEEPVSSKVGIQAEIIYTEIGGSESYYDYVLAEDPLLSSGELNFDYQLSQLQVPISVKYYFIPNLSASAGMNFAINISKKVKADVYGNGTMTYEYENVKTLNLFPFLGAEYRITDNFFVDARYNFNFFEINKEYLPTKIGFLQAGVGYRFK